jgi:hypothetical protein
LFGSALNEFQSKIFEPMRGDCEDTAVMPPTVRAPAIRATDASLRVIIDVLQY